MPASILPVQSSPHRFVEGAPPRINGQIQALALSVIATFVSFVVLPWQAALVVSIGMTTLFHMLCACPDQIGGRPRSWYEPLDQFPTYFINIFRPPVRHFPLRRAQHEEFRFPASQPLGTPYSSPAHSVVGGGHTQTPVSRTFAPSAPPLTSVSVGGGHTPAPISRSPEPPPPSSVARVPVGRGHTDAPSSSSSNAWLSFGPSSTASSSSSSSTRSIPGSGHTPAPVDRTPEPAPPSSAARIPVGRGHTDAPASSRSLHWGFSRSSSLAPVFRTPEPTPPSSAARAPVGRGHTATPASTTLGTNPVSQQPQRVPVGQRK